MMESADTGQYKPILIKKYANRRLYNTDTSNYVTLDYLCGMVKDGKDFVVCDAKSGEDITRTVLTQIILEQDSKGESLFPVSFLRQVISFYDDGLGAVLPKYLEQSMKSFVGNQEKMREAMDNTFGNANPFNHFEAWGRQNMAFFANALTMFTSERPSPNESTAGVSQASNKNDDIESLKAQVDAMQSRLDALANQTEK